MANRLLSSSTLTGDSVVNGAGEDLGSIKDLMIDTEAGKVEYAVLSCGGWLGIANKYFAVPFTQFDLDRQNHRLVLNVDKEHLKNAPGFDKGNWPDFSDETFRSSIDSYY